MEVELSEENVENFEIFRFLSQKNPGACSVIVELIKNVEHKELVVFLKKIIVKNILGARLWYVYKNECNHDIKQLIEKDLTPFDDKYFYEKFEQFI